MNILIVKLGAAGDVVRTTALLPGLKDRYPDALIDWLAEYRVADLLVGNPLIHRVFYIGDLTELRKQSYDLVINLDEDEEVCHLATQIPTKQFFGAYVKNEELHYTDDAAPWFDMGLLSRHGKETADKLKLENRKSHPELFYNMLGLRYSKQRPHVPLDERARAFAASFARTHGITTDAEVIGINTGSRHRWRDKRLGITETVQLMQGILKKKPTAKLIVLGGPSEAGRNEQILAAVPEAIDGGSHNELKEFAAIVNLCDTVVTSDSLALHIANALGKKTVAFFAPTSPWEIELYDRGIKVLPVKGCLACYRPRCEVPPEFDINAMVEVI